MLKELIIISCLVGSFCDDHCSPSISNSKNNLAYNVNMNSVISIKNVVLLVKEESIPPIGIPIQPNRDIGFATVFLTLENPQERSQIISIENIEIRSISDYQMQNFIFEPKQIELKPLENSVIDIHLTNKTGFVGREQVKAIISYKIDDQVNLIESNVTNVER